MYTLPLASVAVDFTATNSAATADCHAGACARAPGPASHKRIKSSRPATGQVCFGEERCFMGKAEETVRR